MLENLKVPDFEAAATSGKTFKLAGQRGRGKVCFCAALPLAAGSADPPAFARWSAPSQIGGRSFERDH